MIFTKFLNLGFQEFKTQAYLLSYLDSLPQDRTANKTVENGYFCKNQWNITTENNRLSCRYRRITYCGRNESTIPFSAQNEMHACGHDFHMSIALGVLTYFVHHSMKDDLLFIFQPAEEGPGGAEPMLKSEIMKEWKPDMILALHIAPEYPVGTIAIREGLLFANTSELFIDLKGKGGHAAYPHQTNDMIIAACSLVTQLQTIISRNVDPLDSAVITIGKIISGTVQNIIAEKARLDGTIRAFSAESMDKVKKRIENVVRGIEVSYQCEAKLDFGSMYYQVYNEAKLTREFMEFVRNSNRCKCY